MRVLLQRVTRAAVRVDDEVVGRIGAGLVLLVGQTHGDGSPEVDGMAEKVANLRVFADGSGKMNRSLLDTGGGALVVSQFTLYGDCVRGRRPSFVAAARPEIAEPLVDRFSASLKSLGVLPVETGRFGATMAVELENDGPVTLWLEREAGKR